MALGSKSTTSIRTAVDSILREFCKYDEDREKWLQEKLRLEQEINCYKKQLEDKDAEYSILLKRYKVLEISIKNKSISTFADNSGDIFNENLISSMKSSNIKLKLKSKKKNKQTWSATLPTSLSPQKIMNFLDSWGNNNNNDNNDKKIMNNKQEKIEEKIESKFVISAQSKQEICDIDANSFKLQLTGSITLRHHLDCVRSLCLNDDESVLISGSDDGTIKLWDLSKISPSLIDGISGQLQRNPIPITFRGHSSSVNNCCIMPNTNILITAGFDTNLFGWKLPINGTVLMDMESLQTLRLFEMKQHTDIIWDISPHISSPIISSISSDSTIKIFNIETQELILNKLLSSNKYISPTCLEWNNFAQQKICIGTVSGHIILFDVEKQMIISDIIDSYNDNVYCINRLYSDDNLNSNLIYSACDDSRVRVFDINNKKCIISQKVHTDSVTSMVIHSSSSSILTASHDSRLRVWNFKTNKFSCIQDLEPQDTHPIKWDEGILCMTFNNSYKWLFSGGADGIKLYQTNL